MSFRGPAIQRIALAFSMLLAVASAARGDSLFGGPDAPTVSLMPDRSASTAARYELNAARLMLSRTRIAAVQLQAVAETEFRNAGGYSSLQVRAARAVSIYQAARRAALAGLQRDAEYNDLNKRREALRTEIRRVSLATKNDQAKVVPLANEALEAGERLTRSESIMLALDPAVEDARGAMTDAFAALNRLTQTAKQRAIEYPIVVSAREDVEHARQRVSVANFNLVAALRAEAAADRTRDAQMHGRRV